MRQMGQDQEATSTKLTWVLSYLVDKLADTQQSPGGASVQSAVQAEERWLCCLLASPSGYIGDRCAQGCLPSSAAHRIFTLEGHDGA
ncbi:uncharacterized protein LOC144007383 isoform X4 [Festucalex cinctus]